MLLNPQITDQPSEFKNGNNANGNANGRHHGRRRRRQLLHGRRQAALRAFHAARYVLRDGYIARYAAMCCGSNERYVVAMVVLIQSENAALLNQVLAGYVPVLQAAESMKNAAAAITALRKCSGLERESVRLATGATNDVVTMLLNLSADQRTEVSKALGADWLWSNLVLSAMSFAEMLSAARAEESSKVVSESAIESTVA